LLPSSHIASPTFKHFKSQLHAPKLIELARLARAWAEQNRNALEAAEPEAPSGIVDRRLSNWRPLLAVADAAGGEWPTKIRNVAVWVEAQKEQEGELRILSDCKEVWDLHFDLDFLPTQDLLRGLNEREDWPWAGWNNGDGLKDTQLAAQLRMFGVCPKQRRAKPDFFGNSNPKRGAAPGAIKASKSPVVGSRLQPDVVQIGQATNSGANMLSRPSSRRGDLRRVPSTGRSTPPRKSAEAWPTKLSKSSIRN
jgi:hypothetical protein